MTHRRIDRMIGVPAGRELDRPVAMAVTVHLPESIAAGTPILFLFPGATYGRGYFDIRSEGFDGYSQAEHHARHGHLTVAVDHLGTGGSRWEGEGPTLAQMTAACDGAVRGTMAMIREGTLDPGIAPVADAFAIGVGQSMGGHVVVMSQAMHRSFAGVAALGSSFTQTRLALKPGRRYPPRDADPADLVRTVVEDHDLLASFHWPETPATLIERDFDTVRPAPWRAEQPASAGSLLLPGALAREAAIVSVPVLLAYGEVDVTAEPLADVGMFRSATDIMLRILPRMSHMHNFAPTRARLWRVIEAFAERLRDERRDG